MKEITLPTKYSQLSGVQKREVRLKYVELQNNLCYLCNSPLSVPPPTKLISRFPINRKLYPIGFFRYPIHLHHNHKTDMTLGAVHNYCNAVLWEHLGE